MRGRRALDDRGLGRVLLRLIAATDAAGGVSFGLAFAAGLLSFLSPCVLPLIPSYVGFLTGLSLEELRPAFLMRERRLQLARKPLGYLGSGVVGIAFGAAWTPCVGPILGAILTLAAAQASVGQGVVLLGVYALGLAVPFPITAYALDRFLTWFQRFRPYIVWVDRTAGALLVLLGVLLLTDRFTLIASYLPGLTPQFLKSRLGGMWQPRPRDNTGGR